MSVIIKSLTQGDPVVDSVMACPQVMDKFNIIPADTSKFYTLYKTPVGMSTIINSVRLVNTSTGSAATVNLYFNRPTVSAPAGQPRRRSIAPINMSIAVGSMYVDDSEITLEAGDCIQASASQKVHYLISGVERAVL